MTVTSVEHTVLPPVRREGLAEALAALAQGRERRVALVTSDGAVWELPSEVFEVLREVLQAMSQGLAITIAPQHTVLTTGEAADLLGVSRPTLVRLLESGEIPFEQPGRHRRVRLADLIAYQARSRRARAASLDEMVRSSEAAGLYDLPDDLPDDLPFERLPTADDKR
jgi:excisionase family DNA binding protein